MTTDWHNPDPTLRTPTPIPIPPIVPSKGQWAGDQRLHDRNRQPPAVLGSDLGVELGEFTAAEDELGFSETVLVVTVTNKSAVPVSGDLTVAADAADGSRIDEDYASVDNLQPGQKTRIRLFEYVTEDDLAAMQQATFSVVEASVY